MTRTEGIFVVRLGCEDVFRTLQEYFADSQVRVIWDRRRTQRRRETRPFSPERRRATRRRPLPVFWDTLGYIFVPQRDVQTPR